jgi:hypothetical protein
MTTYSKASKMTAALVAFNTQVAPQPISTRTAVSGCHTEEHRQKGTARSDGRQSSLVQVALSWKASQLARTKATAGAECGSQCCGFDCSSAGTWDKIKWIAYLQRHVYFIMTDLAPSIFYQHEPADMFASLTQTSIYLKKATCHSREHRLFRQVLNKCGLQSGVPRHLLAQNI